MIKILLILFLSSACILKASASKFGLTTAEGQPLELLLLKTKALVEGPYAEVQYIQTYKNPLNHTVETEFLFPRTESSIFHKFEAVFQNQTIVGRVLEKETAKKMYEWNTERGNTVAYSERNKVSPDVMNIKVGNIPANETVEIVFSIIQPLETIINKFYELRLPVVLTERYSPASVDHNNTPNIRTVETTTSLYKEWNIEVEVKSNTPFAILSNPTHNLKPELSEKPSGSISKIYKAVWNATIVPNKDFVVYFGSERLEKPETILATYPKEPNNHVLLVNFIPDLTTIQPKVAQDLLENHPSDGFLKLKRMAYEYDTEHAQAEFIFVIDRSGSMQGARIENLRRALKKFLNTIPKTSYFNIISFGSSYQLYRSQSVLNSPQALEQALNWVSIIQADMGGTEILEALKALTDEENRATNLPKIIMVLTDGDVFNPDEVINHISANANKMRFCSVGIGSGASDYLVRNMAKAGKCRSEFVQEHEDIGDKALYMVQAAISHYVTDIKFDINCFNDNNENIYTENAELDLLMKDQAFNKWIYLENIPNLKSCHATLAYYNGLQGKRVSEEMDIQAYEVDEITNFWHKIAYDARIKELEQGIKMKKAWYKGEDAQSLIVKLSTKYQILSDYTSFLAVLQESTVDPNEITQKISIPSVKSADYFANPKEFKPRDEDAYYANYNYKPTSKYNKANNYYEDVDVALDLVMSMVEIAVDVELEYIGDGDCEEIDISVSVDVDDDELDVNVNVFSEDKEKQENEKESGGSNIVIMSEGSHTNSEALDLDTKQASWNCENVDSTIIKECSQMGNEREQEREEPKEEFSSPKLIESSDLKLVNNTNHTIHSNLTEASLYSREILSDVSSVISDEKEAGGLEKSKEKSSKILGDGFNMGLSFLIILLSMILS